MNLADHIKEHAALDVAGLKKTAALAANAGNTIALIGDSITNSNYTSSGGNVAYAARGIFAYTNFRLGQRFFIPPSTPGTATPAVFCTAGYTAAQILTTHVPSVLAMNPRPKYCWVMAGSNDVISTPTASATLKATLTSIYQQLNNAGIVVIACTVMGRADCSTAPQLLARNTINQWLRNYANYNSGLILIDTEVPYCDETGAIITNYSFDTIHPTNLGCLAIAEKAYNTLNPLIPVLQTTIANNDDATSIVTNGRFTGSGGSNSGGGTGTVATSWTNNTTGAGVASAASKVVRTGTSNPGSWQQIAVTTAAAAGTGQLQQQLSSGWAVGDILIAECDAEIDFPAANVYGAELLLNTFGTTNTAKSLEPVDTSISIPNTIGPNADGKITGRFRTPMFQIPVGATSLFLYAKVYTMATAGSVCNLRIDRVTVRPLSYYT